MNGMISSIKKEYSSDFYDCLSLSICSLDPFWMIMPFTY